MEKELRQVERRRKAPLILASGSPRRRELLQMLGVPFEVATALAFRERSERDNRALSPAEFAWHNASGKARAAGHLFPGRTILAADTLVTREGILFGKPLNRAEAEATLAKLEGKSHSVLTAVALIHYTEGRGCRLIGRIERTEVVFRSLDSAQIARYLDLVPVLDKAGAYAIQDHGAWIVEAVRGSLSNVIGLPLSVVADLLRVPLPPAVFQEWEEWRDHF